MADNDYVNKVELSDGSTLIDLTGDTATASDVVRGKSLHLASGAPVTGTLDVAGAISDSDIDSVVADEAPTGTDSLRLTGLSYLWSKLKAALEGFLPLSGGKLFGDLSVGERTGNVNVSVISSDTTVFEAVVDKEADTFTSTSGDGTVGMSMSHNGSYATLTVNFISGSTVICSVVANENNADIRSISRFTANSYSTSYATVSGTNYSDATLVIELEYVEAIKLENDGDAWFAGEVSATEEVTEGGTTTTVTHNLTEKADADHTHTVLGNDNTKKVTVNANGVSECSGTASGNYSHAEGFGTQATQYASHAEGYSTNASGSEAHAEGYYTTASASGSHAEGYQTEASGGHSHAEGYGTKATSDSSHAEGYQAQATGGYSHAEGFGTKATAQYSHAEGKQSEASGLTASHAEGEQTTASGNNAHSEGRLTVASGKESHAEGYLTYAEGESSHASGTGVVSKSKCQFGMGRYNVATQTIVDTFTGNGSTKSFSTSRVFERIVAVKRDGVETDSYMRNSGNSGITFMSTPASGVEITVEYYPESKHALIIGNGTSDAARSNALAVRWDGLIDIGGTAASDGTSNGDAKTCYPTFIIGGWSDHSSQSVLPVTPCFVFNPANYSYYYCNGTWITRINPDEYMPIYSMTHSDSNLDWMAQGEVWWGNNLTNAPTTNYYDVERFSSVQIAYEYVSDTSAPRVYVRMCPNGIWQPWANLMVVGDSIQNITWPGGHNLTATATANNQEWSIDMTPGSYTGTYWQVWSSKNSRTVLACYADDNSVRIPNGDLRLSGSASIGYQGTKAYYQMIKFKDNTSDTYGNGIIIGGGGLTVIGGGESANAVNGTISTGGDERMIVANDGNVEIWSNCQNGAGSAKKFYFNTNGRVTAAGYDTSSDKRLKTHIDNLGESAVEFVKLLRPTKFEMDGDIRVGFYAQDIQEICDDIDMVSEGIDGMLSLDYSQLIAPLVATVQKLTERVEQLEAEIAELKA